MAISQSALGYQYGFNQFLKQHISQLPKSFQNVVLYRYQATAKKAGIQAAIAGLNSIKQGIKRGYLLASSDAELCAHAEKMAEHCALIGRLVKGFDEGLAAMCEFAVNEGVQVPGDKVSKEGRAARLKCAKWWRRAIRRGIARHVEGMAIDLGLVHKKKNIYASDETIGRRRSQKRRNAELLKRMIATNEEGQEFTLEELSAVNVSNPELRRAELMTRIAGFDEVAREFGHVADFYTMTAPSRFHARLSDGKPNPKYDGSNPKEAQAFLSSTWAQVRAYLASRGVNVYGFRVCEPHHDGTPHWHMIIFCEKRAARFVRVVIADYARGIRRSFLKHDGLGGFDVAKNTGVCWLSHDGGEAGAAKHRSTVQRIDYSKGNAAGYLAKYISKNIDGHGLKSDEDYEGGEVAENVDRVEAWAACWGIRQFQQIGGAPVGVWRELRRVKGIGSDLHLNAVWAAADAGNWADYTRLMGGVFVSRDALAVKTYKEFFADAVTLYDGQGIERICGVYSVMDNAYQCTRVHEWVLKRAHAPAWSSVNNCNDDLNGLGVMDEKIAHFVRPKMADFEAVNISTGIREGESLREFDLRGFRYG